MKNEMEWKTPEKECTQIFVNINLANEIKCKNALE